MARKNLNKITDSTTFWFIVVLLVAFVLIGLGFYWFKVLNDRAYYNYEGKGGDYQIGKSKVGNVVFYHISVFFEGKEYIYSFRNHPKDLEDVYLEPDLDNKLNRPGGIRTLYVINDPELVNMTNGRSVIATVAFQQILGGEYGFYGLNVENAYTAFVNNGTEIITCDNVDDNTAVIYVKIGEETKVYSEDDCIIVQGRGQDGIIRAGEKFAYYLIGLF